MNRLGFSASVTALRAIPVTALFAGVLATATPAAAQFDMQDSNTSASLRGIASPGNGVAWASGTDGTVLRTEDSGFVWQGCAMPPGAEKLDFRGVQAFDGQTALVMSSGKGSLSRVYKTSDGCRTWKLVFTNPDADGFFDAMQFSNGERFGFNKQLTHAGVVVGDPVNGKFMQFKTNDDGDHWSRLDGGQAGTISARDGESLFAASNSSLLVTNGGGEIFVTGGRPGPRSRILSEFVKHEPRVSWKYVGGQIPLGTGDSAGAFSIAIADAQRDDANTPPGDPWTMLYLSRGNLVVVGGDYSKPNRPVGTAARSDDSGIHWTAAVTPPQGYRSSVAYDAASKTWITVGPNGTDISRDDGRNWSPLRPSKGDAGDADKRWNALALPFVVGPNGRIGRLQEGVLTPAGQTSKSAR